MAEYLACVRETRVCNAGQLTGPHKIFHGILKRQEHHSKLKDGVTATHTIKSQGCATPGYQNGLAQSRFAQQLCRHNSSGMGCQLAENILYKKKSNLQ